MLLVHDQFRTWSDIRTGGMPTFTVTSTDTISTQHSLTGNQTITSGGGTGTFVLGFFTTPGSCGNYYIGIWYDKISVLTLVWVANRVTLVTHTETTTSEIKISHDGNL
ncbi:hypothetical protein ZIOFF_017682 [Zingiber officinale]|uniref:Bulb-type lectin domain-containing protein n=1 Tax=Zingiber officinale TaxID=94328 RepID=A0A8J5HJZ8_ZINOF|nr:hypothetical protein ZIOFF_017682 [Zingiber officinale]